MMSADSRRATVGLGSSVLCVGLLIWLLYQLSALVIGRGETRQQYFLSLDNPTATAAFNAENRGKPSPWTYERAVNQLVMMTADFNSDENGVKVHEHTEPSYFLRRIPTSIAILAILVSGGLSIVSWASLARKRLVDRMSKAEQEVRENPTEARPLWLLASTQLELYYQRNLEQIRSIFWITTIVMIVGFSLIGTGVYSAFSGSNLEASHLAAISGVLTEFIAATFLIIYRSTMKQANQYVDRLERINSVGMCIQVIETIPDNEPLKKNDARVELSQTILRTINERFTK